MQLIKFYYDYDKEMKVCVGTGTKFMEMFTKICLLLNGYMIMGLWNVFQNEEKAKSDGRSLSFQIKGHAWNVGRVPRKKFVH